MAEPVQPDPQAVIEGEVLSALDLQKSLEDMQTELMQNEKFRQFLELSKTVPAQIEATWQKVRVQMEAHNIKSIKGEFGSITLAERLGFDVDEEQLQPEYFKLVPDTKKIGDVFRLEGEAPAGATPKTTKYLVKRLK